MSKVYLVGAGPGDPELITWKGRRALEKADAVLFDNLASRALLNLVPESAECTYVGKKRAKHSYSQEDICSLLIELARAGKTVVRLKGGDPLIFGRGGEEAEALAEAGVEFQIIPGVTTPVGIAAYTGVPLTHREHTSVVTFLTGHEVDRIDWDKVSGSETLVMFMALMPFEQIAKKLIENGRSPDTPAMAVRWATRADQQTVSGTLADLPEKIKAARLLPPATIVIGPVVNLRQKLNWFERLPLFGRRVVITRARRQSSSLAERLRALGAEIYEFPTIESLPLDDYSRLDAAIHDLASYDWLVFTSVNGVEFFLKRLDASSVDLRALRARICAIGPATRRALEDLHLKVDLTPKEYVAEGLLDAFALFDMKDKRVLLPRAEVAREVLPEQLRERGAQVDVIPAYRTVLPDNARDRAEEVFYTEPQWILFTSSSTVNNCIEAAGREALEKVRIASIGPVTSETICSHGLEVAAEASPYTIEGLIQAVLDAERRS